MLLPRALRRLSAALVWIDRIFLMALVAAIGLLVLMNVGTRAFGVTIAWADELAVQAMILAGFVGASLMLRGRADPAVTLLYEVLPRGGIFVLRVSVSTIAFGFGLALIWMCWVWFDLPGLTAAGFDVSTFEGMTFNFLYTEITPVMEVRAVWFFLIMPWFALTLTVHALTNLAEDAGLLPRPEATDAIKNEG